MRYRSGSLTAEALASLFAAALFLPLCAALCRISADMVRFDAQLQDALALQQLQRILMISYDLQADERVLAFTHQGMEKRLSQVNDHVILQPGTQIILADTEDAGFYMEEGCICLWYQRKDITYETMLFCGEEGNTERMDDSGLPAGFDAVNDRHGQ